MSRRIFLTLAILGAGTAAFFGYRAIRQEVAKLSVDVGRSLANTPVIAGPIVGSWAQTVNLDGTGNYIWDTEINKSKVPEWDQYFELVNGRSGVKIKVPGFYHISYNVRLAPDTSGRVITIARVDGVNQLIAAYNERDPSTTSISHANRSLWINAGQIVTINLDTGVRRNGNRIGSAPTTGSTTNLNIYRLPQ